MLTARPLAPKLAAVRAAPTVPEWSTAKPVFGPLFTPEATSSGGSPRAPRRAVSTARAGGPSTAWAGTPIAPSTSTAVTPTPSAAAAGAMAAPTPLWSCLGAATTTSNSAATAARMRAARPGVVTPSSLVTSTRIGGALSGSGGWGGRGAASTGALVEVLVGHPEIPAQDEGFPLRVAHHALPVPPELGVVGRQQQQPGQRPLAERLDQVALAELGDDLPVRGDRTEVDDTHVAPRGPLLLELFRRLCHAARLLGGRATPRPASRSSTGSASPAST